MSHEKKKTSSSSSSSSFLGQGALFSTNSWQETMDQNSFPKKTLNCMVYLPYILSMVAHYEVLTEGDDPPGTRNLDLHVLDF